MLTVIITTYLKRGERMRKSRQRDAILDYVKLSVEHPTADMV